MGFYQFKREQFFNLPKEELWNFISRPENLKKITPEYMGFEITSELTEHMYQGMIISYKVRPLAGFSTTWVTEITNLKENEYFVDEQSVGPYKMWHHQHILTNHNKGTNMIDIVSYQPPFGLLGNIVNRLMIEKKLKEIFDYRKLAMEHFFGNLSQ